MRIANYTVEGELGRGGMGIVLRARGLDGLHVAIKILRTGASPRVRERFDRERRLLASFTAGDGFVPTLGTGEASGEPYIVMPLLEGGTLRDRLKRGALPVDETIALARALARALATAHAKRIVHRDLKPENILFATTDAGAAPLVADLGLAKHFAGDRPGASQSVVLSRAGDLMGTVGYMPPEQMRDASTAGPAADVFALGAIIYECLAGWPAFEGKSVLDLMDRVMRESASPLANVRPETPPWLCAVVAEALARDPARRYPDARALLEALDAGPDGAPATAASRRLTAVGIVACLALVVVGLLALRRWADSSLTPLPTEGPQATPSPAATSTNPDASPLDRACARLAQAAPVTSADAPAALLLLPQAREKLLAHVARRMIVYSVEDASRVESALGRGPETAAILGYALLASGRPADQAPGLEALRRGKLTPSTRSLLALAKSARVLAEGNAKNLEGTAAADLRKAAAIEATSVTTSLKDLASCPLALVEGALDPFTRSMAEESASTVRYRSSPHVGFAADAFAALATPGLLTPRLEAVVAAFHFLRGSGGYPERERAAFLDRRLMDLALACRSDDRALAAAFLASSVRLMNVETHDPSFALDAGLVDARLRLGLELEPRLEPGSTSRALAEEAIGGACWLGIVGGVGSREECLSLGPRAMRSAIEIRGTSEVNATRLAQLLLESPDPRNTNELARLMPQLSGSVALRAEGARLMTGPEAALAMASAPADPFSPTEADPYCSAVRAISFADTGRFGEARAEVVTLEAATRSDSPLWAPLPRLRAAAVRAHVEERARAAGH